jgi:hypothetical protein
MTERKYENAVEVLQRHLGSRWDGVEPDGRSEMIRLLRSELGLDASAADDAITEMIRSGELRYHRGDAVGTSSEAIEGDAKPIAMAPNAPAGSGLPGAGFESNQGYWEIGAGSEGRWEGRAGQVEPT